jgi:hypothetical protein
MGNELDKYIGYAKSAWRIAKGIGPLLISQSETASEKWADHQLRLAKVEAMKVLLLEEAKIIADTKRTLTQRLIDAAPEERIRLRRDIEDATEELRKLHIYSKAVDQLPPPNPQQEQTEAQAQASDPQSDQITPHWMDKFNDFAKAANEEWRTDLLAKALTLEAQEPNTISLKALWFIGTVDEMVFHEFAALLDVSWMLNLQPFIGDHERFNDRVLPTCQVGKRTLGNVMFDLDGSGLFGDPLTSEKHITANTMILSRYHDQVRVFRAKSDVRFRGILPTALGVALAKLYTPKPNDLGLEMFKAWVAGVNPDQCEIMNIAESDIPAMLRAFGVGRDFGRDSGDTAQN